MYRKKNITYYISQPPGVSLEEHITLLEEMYSQGFEDKINAGVMADIWNQIQALHEKLSKQTVVPAKEITAFHRMASLPG